MNVRKQTLEKALSTGKENSLPQLAREETILKVTSNMLLTVDSEAKFKPALNSHEKLIELIKLLNVNMGVHHYERR